MISLAPQMESFEYWKAMHAYELAGRQSKFIESQVG
jgi:hypothetical protein